MNCHGCFGTQFRLPPPPIKMKQKEITQFREKTQQNKKSLLLRNTLLESEPYRMISKMSLVAETTGKKDGRKQASCFFVGTNVKIQTPALQTEASRPTAFAVFLTLVKRFCSDQHFVPKGCGPSSRWQACILFEQIEVCGGDFCCFVLFFGLVFFSFFLKRCSHFQHIQKKVSGYLVCFKKLALRRQVGEGMILPHTPSVWCISCLKI